MQPKSIFCERNHLLSECDCSWKTYKFNVCFRDQTLTGKAGEVLLREFVARIGLPELIDAELHLKQRERGDPESETVLSLCWNAILGGSFLLDLNVLRGDAGLRELLGVQSLMAPTTAGGRERRQQNPAARVPWMAVPRGLLSGTVGTHPKHSPEAPAGRLAQAEPPPWCGSSSLHDIAMRRLTL